MVQYNSLYREIQHSPWPRLGGARVGWLGASITNGSASSNAATTAYPIMTTKAYGSYRLQSTMNGFSIVQGYPGQTSTYIAQFAAELCTKVDVLVLGPDFGTNSAGAGFSRAVFETDVRAVRAAALNAGIPIVFSLVMPRGSINATSQALQQEYNRWLLMYCRLERIPLVDTFSLLCDPATQFLYAAYDSGDGTHPNDAGHLALANSYLNSTAFQALFPLSLPFHVMAGPADGLVSDSLLQGTVGKVAGAVSATQTNITQADWPGMLAPAGKRFTIDNSAGGTTVNATYGRGFTTGFTPGDLLYIVAQIRDNSASATGGALKFQILNQSAAVLSVMMQLPPSANPGPIGELFYVPSGTTSLNCANIIQASAGQIAIVDWGGLKVLNLSTDATVSLYGVPPIQAVNSPLPFQPL